MSKSLVSIYIDFEKEEARSKILVRLELLRNSGSRRQTARRL